MSGIQKIYEIEPSIQAGTPIADLRGDAYADALTRTYEKLNTAGLAAFLANAHVEMIIDEVAQHYDIDRVAMLLIISAVRADEGKHESAVALLSIIDNIERWSKK